MFAYCLNNPIELSDKDGENADSFSGWAGEEFGKLIYEWLTGEEHPSHQTEEIERQTTCKQIEMFIMVKESAESMAAKYPDWANGLKALNKIRSGVSSVKNGVGLLLAPIPTVAEDLMGMTKITCGLIKAAQGVAEFIAVLVGGAYDE